VVDNVVIVKFCPRLVIHPAFHIRRLRRFIAARRAAAAVEFAISALALLLFLFGIINLGYLGLQISALEHGVVGAARKAGVTAAANLTGNGAKTTCPTTADIQGYFNSFAAPPLRAATGAATDGSPVLTFSTGPWVNNGAAGTPAGTYLTITATYRWIPIGFPAYFGVGLNLSITSAAFVMGTGGAAPC
jgi:Flp pilus assembly protein TadG